MQSEVKQRLVDYLSYLGIGQKAFAESVGLSAGFVNSIRVSIQPKTIDKISAAYPELNTSWLLTGDGDMLKGYRSSGATPSKSASDGKHIRYWYDIDATAGGVESFNDICSDYTPITLPDFGDCTDAVNVRGESMQPLYNNGDIIILKEWTESFIEYGNVYLVVTRSGNRMIKRIRQGSDKLHVLCVSENPLYDAFEIERADILRMYVVKGSISKTAM